VEKKNFLERQAGADGTPGEFGHQALLNDLNTRVDALYARANALAKNITQGMDTVSNHNMTWSANKDAVQSEAEYEGALTSLLTDYGTLQAQLVLLDSKIEELKQTKKELEDTTAQLNKTAAELKTTKDEKTALAAEVAKLKKRIRELVGDDDTEVFVPKADLHGNILQVNHEFGFVVINLGRKQIREPWMLLVSRGEGKDAKLVARLQVSRSFQKYCIAEILDVPSVDANRNPIKVGDDIYLAKP
jgi:prefoldin subunit 5